MRHQAHDPAHVELRQLLLSDLDRFYQVSFQLTGDAAAAERVVLDTFEALSAYPRGASLVDALKEIAIATVKQREATRHARLN